MLNQLDTEHYKGYEIKIYADDDCESPFEWGSLCNFKALHRSYGQSLSNVEGYNESQELDEFINSEDLIYLPLYGYEHGSFGISTSNTQYPFNCPFDSGQLGYVWLTVKEIKEENKWKRITKERRQKIIQRLIQDVETMNQYVSGEIYGYTIENEENGDSFGSCWGFYGSDNKESGLLEAAMSDIDFYIIDNRIKHNKYLKQMIINKVPLEKREPALV